MMDSKAIFKQLTKHLQKTQRPIRLPQEVTLGVELIAEHIVVGFLDNRLQGFMMDLQLLALQELTR